MRTGVCFKHYEFYLITWETQQEALSCDTDPKVHLQKTQGGATFSPLGSDVIKPQVHQKLLAILTQACHFF